MHKVKAKKFNDSGSGGGSGGSRGGRVSPFLLLKQSQGVSTSIDEEVPSYNQL